MERGAASNLVLITIGAATALLVGVSLFLALQPPTQFDPQSPQGTAQGYFQAINDGDDELAESYLTDDLRGCSSEWWYNDPESARRVVITETKIDGDTAKVKVDITVTYGDEPFGGGSYDREETMTMQRVGDGWLISKPVWPMDRYPCGEGDF
jgi:hypothetical protein